MTAMATMIPFKAKAPQKALVEAVASKFGSLGTVTESDLGGGDERFHDKEGKSRSTFGFVCVMGR